jgi:hypothetical protein
VISVSCARGSTMRAVPQISTLFNPYGLNRSRRRLRDLPVCLDITAPEDATGSQPRSGECLLLEGFELGLRDGARVEKSFRRPDFAGRVAASRDCSDVLICGCRAAFPWSTIRPCRRTFAKIPLISASHCAAATLDHRKYCSSPGWVRTTPPRVDRAGTRRCRRRGGGRRTRDSSCHIG